MEQFLSWFKLICGLLGGMGAFLVGMNMMSDNMSRLAHGKMRTMLNKTAGNRFAGVGIGAGVTMVIQSSAATTVMVVGLVNAGVMTLFQATSIIMGANIGTTITAQIAALSTFDFTSALFILACMGVFMSMLAKNEKVKIIGEICAGLGLIFVGLDFMSSAMSLDSNPEMKALIEGALTVIQNPFLLLLVGVVFTAAIQSSSAVTTIVIAMAVSGFVIGGTGDGVYYVVIGSNIGTCVTALISSIGANTNAKRASMIHLLFNCFGSVIFMIFLLIWNAIGGVGNSFSELVLNRLFPEMYGTQIAMFHTLFNVVCTALFLPFAKGFVWLAEHIIPDKKKTDAPEEELLVLPDARLLKNPSVALGFMYEKTGKTFTYAMQSLTVAMNAFLNKDVTVKEKVQKMNAALVQVNKQDVDYLVKISSQALTLSDEQTISNLHYVFNDIMRIGELADNVTKYTGHYADDNLVFSDEFLTMLKEMYGKIERLANLSLEVYTSKDVSKLAEVDALEDEIDKDRRHLGARHIVRLNEGKCQPQNSNVFINLVGNLERAADHITYIAHSIENDGKNKVISA